MRWIELKIFKFDALMEEMDVVESKYQNMLNRIVASDEDDKEPRREFMEFRKEIEKRIFELDDFYEEYMYDARIVHFEKIRNRLVTLLDTNIKFDEVEDAKEREKEKEEAKDDKLGAAANEDVLSLKRQLLPAEAKQIEHLNTGNSNMKVRFTTNTHYTRSRAGGSRYGKSRVGSRRPSGESKISKTSKMSKMSKMTTL
ncbi:MAG: hypothetical protein MJ252_08685 [archaeon]|nr:hypothetical protein [archaeon]